MTTRRFAASGPRALLVGTMAATLAACGGSSGSGNDPLDPDGGLGDSNGDGIEDVDFDGDGIADDVNADGIEDFDVDGDGVKDVDLNENDIPDRDEDGLGGGGDALSCPAGGSDATSADDQWNNNCVLQRGVTSYYTRGVQRILYCLGYDDGQTAVGDFADAQFGPATQRELQEFQRDRGLTADGIVGPQTWQALRDSLIDLDENADNFDNEDVSYAVDGAVADPACGDQVQFYREYSGEDFTGWKIANNAGDTQRVEFSIRSPFE